MLHIEDNFVLKSKLEFVPWWFPKELFSSIYCVSQLGLFTKYNMRCGIKIIQDLLCFIKERIFHFLNLCWMSYLASESMINNDSTCISTTVLKWQHYNNISTTGKRLKLAGVKYAEENHCRSDIVFGQKMTNDRSSVTEYIFDVKSLIPDVYLRGWRSWRSLGVFPERFSDLEVPVSLEI